MFRSVTVFTAVAAVTSSVAYAQSAAPPNPQTASPAQAQAKTQAEAQAQAQIDVIAKRLCKGEPVVGTRLAVTRRCSTPSELAAYRAQARELIENYRRRPCMAGATAGDSATPLPC